MTESPYLTAQDIADHLRLNPQHVRDRLVKMPGFPAPYVFRGARRWLRDDILEWEQRQRAQPGQSTRQRKKQSEAA